MPLSSTQKKIIDALALNGSSTIREVADLTGLSMATLRVQLPLMVAEKEVVSDRKRQPYMYTVSENSPELKMREQVVTIKRQLMNKGEAPEGIIRRLAMSPKELWVEQADFLEVIVRAVRELEAEGKLVDTLES